MKHPIRNAMIIFAGATLGTILYVAVGRPFSGSEQVSVNTGMVNVLAPVFTGLSGALVRDWLGGDS